MRCLPAWLWDSSASPLPHVGKRVNRPEDLSLQYPHAVHRQWPWLPACLTHSRTNTHTYTGKVLKKNRGERFWWLVGPRDSFFVSAMILSIPLSSLLLHRKQTSILLQFSWTRITRMHAPTYNVAERKGHSAALRSLLGTQWPEGAWVTHKSVQLQNPTRPQKHTNRQRSQKDAPLSDEPANGSSSASCLSPKLKLQSLHLYIYQIVERRHMNKEKKFNCKRTRWQVWNAYENGQCIVEWLLLYDFGRSWFKAGHRKCVNIPLTSPIYRWYDSTPSWDLHNIVE